MWKSLTKSGYCRTFPLVKNTLSLYLLSCSLLSGVEAWKSLITRRETKIGQISTPISSNKIIRHRGSSLGYEKEGFRVRQYILRSKPFSCNIFLPTGREITQKCQQKQNAFFIPRISLLNLRCFVAEVRWLFLVIPQK